MTEQWRDIPGYNGDYQVSDHGRVKSLKYGKERLLRFGRLSSNRYPCVSLWNANKAKMHMVHRLVAAAFIPFDDSRPHVNHKDGNVENNCVSNLEWCTHVENIAHARDVLGVMKGNPGYRKLSEPEMEHVVTMRRQGKSLKEIALRFGVSQTTISTYMRENAPDVLRISNLSNADIPKIRVMRERGMTLRAIGEQFGVSESMICRVLKGNRRNRKEQAS